MPNLTSRLAAGELILIDGATGTELEKLDVPMVEDAWCAMANLTNPDAVKEVHRTNIAAGAELIIANTFPATRHVLERAGCGEFFEELNRIGIELALAARDEAAAASGLPPVPVAGSISTTQQGGPMPPLEVARVNFADQVKIQAEAGADLFILEMMRDIDQTNAILDAAEPTGLPIWVGYSCELRDDEPLLIYGTGGPLADALETLRDRRVELVAIMHTETDQIDGCLRVVAEHWDGPVGVYAHTGRFEQPNWVFHDTISVDDYAEACLRWVDAGVQVIGGCCGIRPHHIEKLANVLPR